MPLSDLEHLVNPQPWTDKHTNGRTDRQTDRQTGPTVGDWEVSGENEDKEKEKKEKKETMKTGSNLGGISFYCYYSTPS